MKAATLSVRPYCMAFFIIFSCIISGCGEKDDTQGTEPYTITIDPGVSYQTISGFGGANRMWGTQFLKPAGAKTAFGMDDTDLGMSLFRVRISSDNSEWPLILESVKEAQKYGVKILASPWSPPAALKSNNSTVAGYLLPANYGAFRDHINAFIEYMSTNGVEIYAVSVQNEPDVHVSYESCDWTSAEMINFLKDHGHLIAGAKVAAPESFHFNQDYTNAILNDAGAAANLDIVAGHIYGGGLASFPLAEQKGKEIWMTEHLLNLNTGQSGAPAWETYAESVKWDETLSMLHMIHESMTHNWNAYIWWYLQRYYSFIGDGEQGTVNGAVLKRGWAFSQFSRFIRPGFVRVKATPGKTTALEITAYEGNNRLMVVIINPVAAGVKGIQVEAPSVSAASAWETTLQANREEMTVNISGKKVVLDISAKSITTVVLEK